MKDADLFLVIKQSVLGLLPLLAWPLASEISSAGHTLSGVVEVALVSLPAVFHRPCQLKGLHPVHYIGHRVQSGKCPPLQEIQICSPLSPSPGTGQMLSRQTTGSK